MPANGLSIGKDTSIVINTPRGIVRFSIVTGFDSNPVVGDLKSVALDGAIRHAVLHEGWEGEIDTDRADDNLDEFWAQAEEDYHNGLDSYAGTINETITEPDGGVSQYRYDGVQFKLKSAGSKKGNEFVKQKLAFYASRRIKVT